MPENQKPSFIIPFFIILLIIFLAFISSIFQGNIDSNGSFAISYIFVLIVLFPVVIVFLYLYRKMNNAQQEINLTCPRCNFKKEVKDIYCANCGIKLIHN